MDDNTTPLGSPPIPQRGLVFNAANTFQSPFFWLVIGAAAVLALQYASKRQAATTRMRNVTGTAE